MIAARGWEEHRLLKEYDGVGMGHMLIRRARMSPASTALRFEDPFADLQGLRAKYCLAGASAQESWGGAR